MMFIKGKIVTPPDPKPPRIARNKPKPLKKWLIMALLTGVGKSFQIHSVQLSKDRSLQARLLRKTNECGMLNTSILNDKNKSDVRNALQ